MENETTNEKRYDVAYLNVSIYFETDLTEEEIQNVISEVEYEFPHNLISETRINGIEINANDVIF